METRTYNVYKIDELPKEAKEKAIENWRNNDDYPWSDDNANSLKAFCQHFSLDMPNFEYGYRSFIDSSDVIIDLKDFAPLTEDSLSGYCADIALIKAITANGSVNEAFKAWLKHCEDDYNACREDDYIIETMQGNDYDFTLEGEID